MYNVDDVKKNPEPFGRYAIWMPILKRQKQLLQAITKERFQRKYFSHCRAGTLEHLDDYFEKAKILTAMSATGATCGNRFPAATRVLLIAFSSSVPILLSAASGSLFW